MLYYVGRNQHNTAQLQLKIRILKKNYVNHSVTFIHLIWKPVEKNLQIFKLVQVYFFIINHEMLKGDIDIVWYYKFFESF